jgi:transposase
MTQVSTITAGIDTSKAKLDAAVHGRRDCWEVENTPSGWKRLAAEFSRVGATRVGIEATGGYESGVVKYLRDNGFTVIVLQPLQVRAYARVRLHRAKNDTIDAVLIAACAAMMEDPQIEPDPRLAPLAEHLTFIEQNEKDTARLKTRLEHVKDARLRRMMENDIKRLEARRAAELLLIVKELRVHDDLSRRFALVLSVPGIGQRTAVAIVVRMPELGRISREQVSALAGLAPYDNDSGTHRGQRHIAGGRKRLRRSLYAAALPASMRWNKAAMELYSRLRARGKTHKAALIACARKLLIYANTVVARGTPWVAAAPVREHKPA